ncbi:MAG: hypothetical protein PHP64_07920 [Actinomycetota bacterium]|nr:hypothetical protein [Actinomycetota bacterium]
MDSCYYPKLVSKETGSAIGRETWTLIQNPNSTSVEVEISYLTPDGKGNVTKKETIPANSRRTFNMLWHSGIDGKAAILVKSLTTGMKTMVERAMYWNSRGAGTETIGGIRIRRGHYAGSFVLTFLRLL